MGGYATVFAADLFPDPFDAVTAGQGGAGCGGRRLILARSPAESGADSGYAGVGNRRLHFVLALPEYL